MYQQTTKVKVQDFLDDEKKRISKIDEKVSIIDNRIQDIKDKINLLEDEYVKNDLEDNINGKEKTEKNIIGLREQLENLEGQHAAYQRMKNNVNESKAKALKIKDEAAKEISKVNTLFQNKINEKTKFENEIDSIKKKISELGMDIEYLRAVPQSIADDVVKISDYIYGKGVLEDRCKADHNGWLDKNKLVLTDLRNG